MNLTKRKLLAILSLELFLYSFVYVPIAFLVMVFTLHGTLGFKHWAILAGPPLLALVVNALMVRTLVLMAPWSDRNWGVMRFGLKLMGLQIALVLLTLLSAEANVAVGCAAILGLIAAAIAHFEDS